MDDNTQQTQTTGNEAVASAGAGAVNNQTQGDNSGTANIDLSGLMSADNPEVFDRNKVAEIYSKIDKLEADRKFFQAKYQQKIGVPDKIEEYGSKFKGDSSYEKFLGLDGVKELQNNLYKHAKENGIGIDAANSMFDFMLKTAVQSGDLDARSEVEIKAEQEAQEKQRIERINPMLEASHRTKEENDSILENFFEGKNMFTSNPEVKDFLKAISEQTAQGYMLATLINDAFDTGNVPKVTGTIATKDKAALEAALAKEESPEVREALMREFFGEGGK